MWKRIGGLIMAPIFSLFFLGIKKNEVSINVNMSILPTKTLSIEEIFDYDPFSEATGYTKEDSPPLGEVNFGYLTAGTHIIGSIPNFYAIKVNVISNQFWSLYIYAETNLIGSKNILPISRLMYAVDDSWSFTPFSLFPKKIKQGGPTNSSITTLDYLLYLKVSDPPDSYGTNIRIEVH